MSIDTHSRGSWSEFLRAVSPFKFGAAAVGFIALGIALGWLVQTLDLKQAIALSAGLAVSAAAAAAWSAVNIGRARIVALERDRLLIEQRVLLDEIETVAHRRLPEGQRATELLHLIEIDIARARAREQHELAQEHSIDLPDELFEHRMGQVKWTDQKGFTLWFTGLSGAGKTTISTILETQLRERGLRLEILDGDVVRENLSKGLGFTKEDRDTNIRRIAFVADLLSRNGTPVIAAAISPYAAIREEARELMGDRFIEIYVKATVDACAERDVKGLYRKAFAGEIKEFTGVSDPYEAPENPEIVLDTELEDPGESAGVVIAYLEEHRLIPLPSAELVV